MGHQKACKECLGLMKQAEMHHAMYMLATSCVSLAVSMSSHVMSASTTRRTCICLLAGLHALHCVWQLL